MSSDYTEFKRGWPVVVASAVGIGLGMSPLPFYTIGVFAGPLAEEFGWGLDQIMLALPVFTFAALFMSRWSATSQTALARAGSRSPRYACSLWP